MLDMETYRQDLFDVFEGTTLDTYMPTPSEVYEASKEDIKNKVKNVFSDPTKPMRDYIKDVKDEGFNKATDKKYKDILNASEQKQKDLSKNIDSVARKIAKSPEERAADDKQQFPDNTHYEKYAQDVKKINNILTGAKAIIWAVGFWAIPMSITIATVKIGVVDNAPLFSSFLKGELTDAQLHERGHEILKQISQIHSELGMLATKLAHTGVQIAKSASNAFKSLQDKLGTAMERAKQIFTTATAATIVANVKAVAKKFASVANSVNTKTKNVKESSDDEITESVFESEEMDIITQLKFAAFENAEDNNPYFLLDEFVEKCNYDNENDFNKLMDAFDYVLAL